MPAVKSHVLWREHGVPRSLHLLPIWESWFRIAMPYDEHLAERIRTLLKGQPGVVEKKMFGGVGFLLDGNMCCGVLKRDLILRLGVQQAEVALKDPDVRVFDITGRAMKGWVMVGPDSYERHESLDDWLQQAIAFVRELPPKL